MRKERTPKNPKNQLAMVLAEVFLTMLRLFFLMRVDTLVAIMARIKDIRVNFH